MYATEKILRGAGNRFDFSAYSKKDLSAQRISLTVKDKARARAHAVDFTATCADYSLNLIYFTTLKIPCQEISGIFFMKAIQYREIVAYYSKFCK